MSLSSLTKKNQPEHLTHPIPPFYRPDSRILVLGSFPSVKSREVGFFYGHPQNRYWKLMARVCGCEVPGTIPEKKVFLEKNHIAMWDTIASCTIVGSSDSSIRDVVPNDLHVILDHAQVRAIFCNGATSYNLFMKYIYPELQIRPMKMPSTSPANAAWNLDRLYEKWKICADYLKGGAL